MYPAVDIYKLTTLNNVVSLYYIMIIMFLPRDRRKYQKQTLHSLRVISLRVKFSLIVVNLPFNIMGINDVYKYTE